MAGYETGPGLLEREAERGELRAALAGAAGAGGVVLVEGPPGMGKTQLLECAADAAQRMGVLVPARGRTSSSSASPTRWCVACSSRR